MDSKDKVQIVWTVNKFEPGYSGTIFTMRATYKDKDKYFNVELDPHAELADNLVKVAEAVESLINTVQK